MEGNATEILIWYCLRLPHVEAEDMETPKVQIQQWFHFLKPKSLGCPLFSWPLMCQQISCFCFSLVGWKIMIFLDLDFRQLQVPREGNVFSREFSQHSIYFSLPPKNEEDPPKKN